MKMDTTNSQKSDLIWGKIKFFGENIAPYFLKAYPSFTTWQGRRDVVFHSIKFSRNRSEAFALGLLALKDKATLVRYRACGLLAYSLNKAALPYLQALLTHKDKKTIEDAKAAIDAIKYENHNYFIDRNHSGKVCWKITQADI